MIPKRTGHFKNRGRYSHYRQDLRKHRNGGFIVDRRIAGRQARVRRRTSLELGVAVRCNRRGK